MSHATWKPLKAKVRFAATERQKPVTIHDTSGRSKSVGKDGRVVDVSYEICVASSAD